MSLGNLGQARPPVEETFGWFGQTIRVHPDLTDAALIDFASDYEDIQDSPTLEQKGRAALQLVKAWLRDVIHPDDFDLFWKTGRANRQSTEDFTDVGVKLVEQVTGRPTQRPSDSSDGPGGTGTNSADGSYSRVMRRLDGRPDLQLLVLEAKEARAS